MANEGVYNPLILRQLLDYDPDTGTLTWKVRPESMFSGNARKNAATWNKAHAGNRAFLSKTGGGYLSGVVLYKRLMAHRVAWCIYHGVSIPKDYYIDHINGTPDDNRLLNLRLATPRENQANVDKVREGLRGAVYHKSTGKWQASARVHLGTFDTEEEAAEAYEEAAKKLHGAFYIKNGKRVTVSRAY